MSQEVKIPRLTPSVSSTNSANIAEFPPKPLILVKDSRGFTRPKEIIVLVHGLFGFGEDKQFPFHPNFRYWGWKRIKDTLNEPDKRNIRKILHDATGLPVFVASISPISANHERACELYGQIRGLCTHYGEKRSAETKSVAKAHKDWRTDFSVESKQRKEKSNGRNAKSVMEWMQSECGWLPDWGETADGGIIHFVGHSMGGNTSRYLESLIHNGFQNDKVDNEDKWPLFSTEAAKNPKRNSCIGSIITISTPHDGSTLAAKAGESFVGLVSHLLIGHASHLPFRTISTYFDLQRLAFLNVFLDQRPLDAISAIQKHFTHTYSYHALGDLTPKWCYEFNTGQGKKLVYPDTRYFAISTSFTESKGECEVPKFGMNNVLIFTAKIMGKRVNEAKDFFPFVSISKDFYPIETIKLEFIQNDGAVTKRSGWGPHRSDEEESITEFVQPLPATGFIDLPKGKWFYVDQESDHQQAVGMAGFPDPDGVRHAESIIESIYKVNVANFINTREVPM